MSSVPGDLAKGHAYEKLAKKIKPEKVVLTKFRGSTYKPIIHRLRLHKKSLPIIAIQHGPMKSTTVFYTDFPKDIPSNLRTNHIRKTPTPNDILIEGKIAKDKLKKEGYSEERLHIIGPIRKEDFSSFIKTYNKKEIVEKLSFNLPEEKKVVLITPGMDDFQYLLPDSFKALSEKKDFFGILRPHPSTQEEALKLISKLKEQHDWGNFVIGVKEDIYHLLAVSDINISTYSSCGIEAIAMEKDVIWYDIPDVSTPSPFLDVPEAAIRAENPNQLKEALDSAFQKDRETQLRREKGRKLIDLYFNGLDGKVKERALEYI
ncbi:hypothetical protein AKJ51_02620 [candidate division MSBL1 archaeon SCGC-AAA382A20]|uniref:Glycosyl transferase family 1 domain-containing protein n=1 Tax=candidate division MSBL1 archaeon SCGC-AAA382A20 TaxID=1698280 RepID=A0A133VKF9_9EURY|nr:hypothetical protein AKJ51_02620 [candidate division MSBL1 archaeon SCGC-AAA382A20]